MSLYFPSSSAAHLTAAASYTATQDLTVCLWGQLESTAPVAYRTFFNTRPGGMFLGTLSDGVTVNFGTDLVNNAGPVLTAGRWYHLAYSLRMISVQNAVMRGFVDGHMRVNVNDTTRTFFNWTSMVMGNTVSGGAYPLNGTLRDVRVWTRALEPHEVRREMMSARPHTAGLIMWLPLDTSRLDAAGIESTTQGGTLVFRGGYNRAIGLNTMPLFR